MTDNLACATIYLVQNGLAEYREAHGSVPAHRHPAIGQLACAVSRGLAALIDEPAAWRIAGLVSTARLLSPMVGIEAAARLAASAARDYGRSLDTHAQNMQLLQVSHSASIAVETNDDGRSASASGLILECLTRMPPSRRALTYDSGGATFRSLTT